MKAAIVERYGPPSVVRVIERPTPSPRRGEILVRVRSVAVTSGDARIRAARFPSGFDLPARLVFGLRKPRRPVLGNTFAGTVSALGPGVTDLDLGAEVAGMTGIRMGAHAEYVAVRRANVTLLPATVSHDDAAGILFGGTTALHYLTEKTQVQPGDTVLVNGAAGAVGLAAVQLAKNVGARVTGVAGPAHAELVRGLGAAEVIDHNTTSITSLDRRFDVVLDAVGTVSIDSGRRLLSDRGVLLLAAAGLQDTIRARGNVKAGPSPERATDFAQLLEWVAAGQLRAVHDDAIPPSGLEGLVAAYERIDSGRKTGNIVLRP